MVNNRMSGVSAGPTLEARSALTGAFQSRKVNPASGYRIMEDGLHVKCTLLGCHLTLPFRDMNSAPIAGERYGHQAKLLIEEGDVWQGLADNYGLHHVTRQLRDQ